MIYTGGIGILKLYKTLNSKSVRLNFDFYYFEKHNFVSKKQVEPKTDAYSTALCRWMIVYEW